MPTYDEAKDAAFSRMLTVWETLANVIPPGGSKAALVKHYRAEWNDPKTQRPVSLDVNEQQKDELVKVGATLRNAEAEELEESANQ
jgi:hypothetical protein